MVMRPRKCERFLQQHQGVWEKQPCSQHHTVTYSSSPDPAGKQNLGASPPPGPSPDPDTRYCPAGIKKQQ
jgi:hypothetical protein